MAILEVEHISKNFEDTEVLKDISFSLEKGEVLSIIGSSGSGKTTFLRCLNFLEQPDTGVIRVNGETLFDASVRQSQQEAEIRRKRLHFGLVFQSFNLFPQYTALGNVMLARELLAKEQPDYKARKKEIYQEIEEEAKALLLQMGLGERMENYPHQLSGGPVPAGGHRPGACPEAGYPLLRRAHLGPRSGADRGGAEGHQRAGG